MKLFALIPITALAACANDAAPVSGPPPLPPASAFSPLAPAPATFDSPLAAADYYARYKPEFEGGGSFDLISRRVTASDALELVFAAEGYADDSVNGEQWRIILGRAGEGWRVTEAGRRFKCYRGANPGQWQKDLCV